MSEPSCQANAAGDGFCAVPSAGQAACQCAFESTSQPLIQISSTEQSTRSHNLWRAVRSGLAFGIACLTSPCCTPLIVPLGLALLAGTPVAVWLAANLGWVYGGLTLFSILSFVLAFHWWNQQSLSKSPAAMPERIVSELILEPTQQKEIDP